jgi:hypothetical protein
MVALLQTKFVAISSEHAIKKSLAQWLDPTPPWCRIQAVPLKKLLSIPSLPIDLLSGDERHILEEAIQAAYLDNAATTALENITKTGGIESEGLQRVIGTQLMIQVSSACPRF